jgi:hypothetical protein
MLTPELVLQVHQFINNLLGRVVEFGRFELRLPFARTLSVDIQVEIGGHT